MAGNIMYLASYFLIRKDAFGYSLVFVQNGHEAFSIFSNSLEYCLNLLFNQSITFPIILQNDGSFALSGSLKEPVLQPIDNQCDLFDEQPRMDACLQAAGVAVRPTLANR